MKTLSPPIHFVHLAKITIKLQASWQSSYTPQ